MNDEHGRVFLSNRIVTDSCAQYYGDLHLRRGPSNSCHKDFDFVYAFCCNTLPPEILSWFHRPRQVNWIPPDVMEAARQCPKIVRFHGDSGIERIRFRGFFYCITGKLVSTENLIISKTGQCDVENISFFITSSVLKHLTLHVFGYRLKNTIDYLGLYSSTYK